MKKNDWLLILATLSYSLLFYHQAQGINYFIFDCIMVLVLALQDRSVLNKGQFLMAAGATVLAGISVTIFGNSLSLVANILSLVLLSGITITPGSSVIIRIFFGFYSLVGSPGFMILDHMERKEKRAAEGNQRKTRNLFIALIPIVVGLLFFLLYRSSSPVFAKYTSQIDLSFISIGWIFFTLVGFIMVYGLFYPHTVSDLANYDVNAPQTAVNSEKTINLFGRQFTMDEENLSGVALLATLNALLLIVNGLDLGFFFSGELPEGMTLSEYVHEGTTALIFSIIIAIAIIMVYFRGGLNYITSNSRIKTLAILWVVQNLIIVGSTAYRNWLYVQEFSLTYKRIGVYVFLLMAVIGLLTTLFKIVGKRSNYFLLRINSRLFYIALLISSFITWDNIIADHNISRIKEGKQLDPFYLMSLSNAVIPQVYDYYKQHGSELPAVTKARLDQELSAKIYLLFRKQESTDWRSFMLMDCWVARKIKQKSGKGEISEMDFSRRNKVDLVILGELKGIKTIKLNGVDVINQKLFAEMDELESLELNRSTARVTSLPTIKNLKSLQMRWTYINDLEAMQPQPELRVLDISRNNIHSLKGIEKHQKLEELNICVTQVENLDPLLDLPNLKKVYLNSPTFSMGSFRAQRPEVELIICK